MKKSNDKQIRILVFIYIVISILIVIGAIVFSIKYHIENVKLRNEVDTLRASNRDMKTHIECLIAQQLRLTSLLGYGEFIESYVGLEEDLKEIYKVWSSRFEGSVNVMRILLDLTRQIEWRDRRIDEYLIDVDEQHLIRMNDKNIKIICQNIKGAKALYDWNGQWPTFNGSTIKRIILDKDKKATMVIQAVRSSKSQNNKGTNIRKVTFKMSEIKKLCVNLYKIESENSIKFIEINEEYNAMRIVFAQKGSEIVNRIICKKLVIEVEHE